MVVVVLTNCPAKLRGHLTRWLLEVSAGVYVGHVPARVRDRLWTQIVEYVDHGKAIMIHNSDGEQRLAFKVHRHEWETLMRRPSDNATTRGRVKKGWSAAAQRRKRRR
ncbi:type I-E CRISPR-associated endoribonuclease Cas2e [Gordonia sp. MP11Mi]|uniref:Uncharacterized protein n=1 Tax=Gordonia sp. MP11Mi TaxID=3022769 RepID=A0AA97CUB5_9ACTN